MIAAQPQEPAPYVLEEVVVMAQKRSENVQDVPVAVSVMTAEMIRESGMQTIKRLTDLNPSVSYDPAQSFQRSSLKIRGIGTLGNSRSFEGAVGVFVDGVYRPRTAMGLMDLLDIRRLEVLRGPQSTLFGKNTVAGAIAIESTSPEIGEAGGYVEARVGNLDSTFLTGALNVPLGEAAALRVAAVHNNRDGTFESPDTGDQYDTIDRYGVKVQLLWEPSENTDILLIADHAKSDANCCWGSAQVLSGPTSGLIALYSQLNGLTFTPAPDAERTRSQSLNSESGELIEEAGLTAKITWQWGDKTLTSITAYRDWEHTQINADPDFTPADLFILSEPADIESFSQEFNLDMTLGTRVDLLLGLYYGVEDYWSDRIVENGSDADNYLNALISANAECVPPVAVAGCLFPVGIGALLPDGEFAHEIYRQDSTSFGIFAHASTELSDRFDLVTGLRYSIEDKDGGVENLFWYDSPIARAVLASLGVPDDGTPRNGLDLIGTVYSPSFEADIRDEVVTGTVSLQYRPREGLMLYGGYHRGYKAGGVNLFREGVITDTTYDPETADSFEIGLKADFWGGRARTNVAAFHTEYSDLQINFFTGLEFRTENTGKATSKGIEIENQIQLSERLRLDLSATYLDSQFDRLDNPFLAYLQGRDTPRAPEWAAVGSLRYERPVGAGLRLVARGLASYTGRHFVGAEVPDEEKADSYIIADASIGLVTASERWEAALWCSNCTDKDYRTILFNSTFQPGSLNVYLNDPRQYGVSLTVRF